MKVQELVTKDEVKEICKELNIRDWTSLKEPHIEPEEARAILSQLNINGMNIELDDFRVGLEVELEHGIRFHDANVTNNHPVLTGKIVLAHLKESLNYYKRLEVSELEGDLLKAIKETDYPQVESLYEKIIESKIRLSQAELKEIES